MPDLPGPAEACTRPLCCDMVSPSLMLQAKSSSWKVRRDGEDVRSSDEARLRRKRARAARILHTTEREESDERKAHVRLQTDGTQVETNINTIPATFSSHSMNSTEATGNWLGTLRHVTLVSVAFMWICNTGRLWFIGDRLIVIVG